MTTPKRTLQEKAEYWWFNLSMLDIERLSINNPSKLNIQQVIELYIKHNPKPVKA